MASRPLVSGGATNSGSDTPERGREAWRAWLQALSNDAEAAIWAALAYETLDAGARDAFLLALEQDAPTLGVPRIAVYAPLLSVEDDENRRARIVRSMGTDTGTSQGRVQAFAGEGGNGERVVVVVRPVYLDFVRVISCRLGPDGVRWVRDEPLMHRRDAPTERATIEGMVLERVPTRAVVDHVALAVVAERRRNRTLSERLRPLLDLLDSSLAPHSDPCLEP